MHLVHLRRMELNRVRILCCGMACHSCCSATPRSWSVVGGFSLCLSPSWALKFSMGLRSGLFEGSPLPGSQLFAGKLCSLWQCGAWHYHAKQSHIRVCIHKGLDMPHEDFIPVGDTSEITLNNHEISSVWIITLMLLISGLKFMHQNVKSVFWPLSEKQRYCHINWTQMLETWHISSKMVRQEWVKNSR